MLDRRTNGETANNSVKNFKNFTSAADGGFIEIALNGKSTVFYGNNGSGKSTLLSAVCYAAWPFINRLNNAQGTGYRTLDKEQLHIGQRSGSSARYGTGIVLQLDGETFEITKEMEKTASGRVNAVNASQQSKQAVDLAQFLMNIIWRTMIQLPEMIARSRICLCF